MTATPEVWTVGVVLALGVGYLIGLAEGIRRERARLRAILEP